MRFLQTPDGELINVEAIESIQKSGNGSTLHLRGGATVTVKQSPVTLLAEFKDVSDTIVRLQ